MSDEKTIFSKIIDREIPADILYEDELAIAIKDVSPKAPCHVLIIPKQALPRLVDASEHDQHMLGHLMLVVGKVAKLLGVDEAFRVVINNGAGAGQTVFHLHMHILANKSFSEDSLGKEF